MYAENFWAENFDFFSYNLDNLSLNFCVEINVEWYIICIIIDVQLHDLEN